MWPFRRRRRQQDYVGRHRPGAWAEVALPPAVEGNRVDAVIDGPDETVTIAPHPAVVTPPAPAVPTQPAVTSRPTVTVAPTAAMPPAAAGPPAVTVPPVALVPEPVAARAPRVRLGFADGTSMDVDAASEMSASLRATASRLLGE